MSDLLPDFDGELTRVRCFAHVLNLVAKSLIRQFDASAGKEVDESAIDEAELAELREVAEELESEEIVTQVEMEADADEDEPPADDPNDDVDPMAEMTEGKRKEFQREVRPVMLVMAKVSSLHRVEKHT